MALRGVAHGQHVVSEECRLIPRRGECHVAADGLLVLQHPNPREAIWVGPYWIEDAGEVDVHGAAAVLHQMWEDVTHLVVRQRVLKREVQLVPAVRSRRFVEQLRTEF